MSDRHGFKSPARHAFSCVSVPVAGGIWLSMHYYSFNIGDYRRDTMHFSMIEHGAYRQLLDWVYLDEGHIPKETEVVFRRLSARTDEERKAIENVLSEMFDLTDDGYVQRRCMEEISIYQGQVDRARINGKLGGRPKKTKVVNSRFEKITQTKANQEPITNNQEPITNNHIEERKKNKRPKKQNSEFPDVFLITDEMKLWAKDLGIKNVENQTELFKDHHKANGETKKDWLAAWRKWMRNCVDWKTEDKAINNSRKGKESYNINNDPNVTTVDGWFIPG